MLLSVSLFYEVLKMKEKKIKVLKVEPHKSPEVVTLVNDLESLQKAVSIGLDYQGLIEIIPIADGVCILCNEEGKLNGMEGNRRLGNDILCGVFYVVGEDDEGNLCSLKDKQMMFYNMMFLKPEEFSEEEMEKSYFFEITDWDERGE